MAGRTIPRRNVSYHKGATNKKEALESRKKTLQSNYEYYRDYEKDFHTIYNNMNTILNFSFPEQNHLHDLELY